MSSPPALPPGGLPLNYYSMRDKPTRPHYLFCEKGAATAKSTWQRTRPCRISLYPTSAARCGCPVCASATQDQLYIAKARRVAALKELRLDDESNKRDAVRGTVGPAAGRAAADGAFWHGGPVLASIFQEQPVSLSGSR